MHKPINIPTVVALLAILMFVSAGCSYSRYYLFKPTVFEKSNTDKEEDQVVITELVSDHDVVTFTNAVKNTLRDRMNRARIARSGGSVIQVLTAAVSAMLTGTSGGSAVGAATILSGTSAIIPDVSNIIGAKERAEAYGDGVKSIENAEAIYLKVIAQTEKGKIRSDKLTRAGATLYDSVVTAIHIVEKRLTGQLPSVEELQKAQAKSEEIEVIPTSVSLKPTEKTTVQVAQGGPVVTASSSNDAIVGVKLINNQTAAEIKAGKDGTATVTLINNRGGSGTVTVYVGPQPLRLSASEIKDLKVGETAEVAVVRGGPAEPQSSDQSVAKVESGRNGKSVTIKGVAVGRAGITVKNESGGSARVVVTVTPLDITLSASEVKNLKVGETVQVTVTKGEAAVHAESSNLSVAKVKRDPDGKSVTIKGVAVGSASITVKNESGGSARVVVTVTPLDITLSASEIKDLKVGETTEVAVVRGGPAAEPAKSSASSIATAELTDGGKSVTIKGVAVGRAVITVTNNKGGEAKVIVEVKGP